MKRILSTSDLHGSTICFRKFLDTAVALHADAAIIAGDLSGKFLTPILRLPGNAHQAKVNGAMEVVRSGQELEEMQRAIENSGSYGKVVSEDDREDLEKDAAYRGRVLLEATRDRLERWLLLAQQRLKPHNIRLLMSFGNDDEWELDELLKDHPFVESLEGGPKLLFEEYEVIGESGGNLTPFGCPRDMPEESLFRRMKANASKLRDPHRALFVLHVPPYDSGIDCAALLDENLVPQTRGGNAITAHVGSTAVRAILEEYQPLVGLHGHIHESPGFCKINRTLCCNAGSEYSTGVMRSVLLGIDASKVVSHHLLIR